MPQESKNLILAITGATGSIYSIALLKVLLQNSIKVHLLISENAFEVIKQELALDLTTNVTQTLLSYLKMDSCKNYLNFYPNNNLSACISSGSYKTDGMIILPCSMNTLASIRAGLSNTLITRAADVCLKQNKKLVLAPREMPFNTTHLENMYQLSLRGVTICVPTPAFYYQPQNIDEIVNYIVSKILDVFEVENELYPRWK